jgi:propanol-preferring alcohol dehydrogenase
MAQLPQAETMRAMLLRRPAPIEERPLEYADVPTPTPRRGEVRLRVAACGICHTDLHTIEGELAGCKLPVIPGHQIVGTVDATGIGAGRFRVGERVGVPWLNSTCGRCHHCKRSQENLCDNARFTGHHVDGGYAQYVTVAQEYAHRLPDGYNDMQAAPLLCAGVIGYRALRLSGAKAGDRLGLYGFGASAHIVIQIARHIGCEVHVCTRSAGHQELAHKLGAAWVGRAEEAKGVLDNAIIFAPAGGLVPEALRALRKGGTLALAGIYMTQIPAMDYNLLYGERTVRSVANSTQQDVVELLEFASRIPIHIEAQTFRLEKANEALQLLKAGRIDGAGVLEVA